MKQLPVIDSCADCGACCMEQQSPPGYVMLLSSEQMMNADVFSDDAERIQNLPEVAIAEIKNYMEQLLAGNEREDEACIWLDVETMRCRYHEFRPSICRDFKIGSDDCHSWRQKYGIT